MTSTRLISTVTFTEEGGVVLTYMDTARDVRNEGLVMMSHQVMVARGEGGKDYGDEIDDVQDAVQRLLKDVLEDFETTEPFIPSDQ